MKESLQLLRSAVTHEWESLDQVLREHADCDLGHPHVGGTPLWHLRHILEIFRIHCAATTEGEVICEGDIPHDPTVVRDLLLQHVDDFSEWARRQSARRLAKPVFYGQQVTFLEMLGIMTRHITWHAAAIHYRIKCTADASEPAPPDPLSPGE